ncbi:hypothetical protein ACH5RR_009450 [Cinchona calisaya]|uniref:F-box domain-containing protein n=1 Tax=Cinchona calisaya TaxID=153742 RepID=A0ABD3AF22_9GENT
MPLCRRIAATQELKEDEKRKHNNTSNIRCSPEEDFWSQLPEDVKVEILCRLPEKDLIGSKLVSKEWNFIISNVCVRVFSLPFPSVPLCALLLFEDLPPPVAEADDVDDDDDGIGAVPDKLHLNLIPFGKYLREVYAAQYIGARPTIQHHILAALPAPSHDPADIQDCCNGLLLFASHRHQCPTEYYLFNPATKQRIAVPVNPNHQSETTNNYHCHCSLVFDPSCFDYNYKVIRYVRSARDATISKPMELDVFLSETGEWSSHVVSFEPHNLYGFEWIRRPVYWDGILYYVSLARYLVYIDVLRSADLGARAVELPDKETIDEECGCIGISSGCLYYSNRHSKRSAMLVWKLVGNCTGWVLMNSISIDDIVASPPRGKLVQNSRYSESFRPCGFHPNDDKIFMAAPRKLLACGKGCLHDSRVNAALPFFVTAVMKTIENQVNLVVNSTEHLLKLKDAICADLPLLGLWNMGLIDKVGEDLVKEPEPDTSGPSLLVTINGLFLKLEVSIGHFHEMRQGDSSVEGCYSFPLMFEKLPEVNQEGSQWTECESKDAINLIYQNLQKLDSYLIL